LSGQTLRSPRSADRTVVPFERLRPVRLTVAQFRGFLGRVGPAIRSFRGSSSKTDRVLVTIAISRQRFPDRAIVSIGMTLPDWIVKRGIDWAIALASPRAPTIAMI
jgi:hypothetical protein